MNDKRKLDKLSKICNIWTVWTNFESASRETEMSLFREAINITVSTS